MRQTMMIMGGVLALSTSVVSFADQCASVTTVNNDVAVLNGQITQHCTGGSTYKVGDLYPNTGTAEGVVIYASGGYGVAVALSDQVDPLDTEGVSFDGSNTTPFDGIYSDYGNLAEYLAIFGGSYTGLTGALPTLPGVGNTNAIIRGLEADGGTTNFCTSAVVGPGGCAAYQAYHYQGPSGTDPLGTWYLPSKEELTMVLSLDDSINAGNITLPAGYNQLETATTGGSCQNDGACYYWSSTEFSGGTSGAWLVDSTNGLVNLGDKNNQFGVRAVRAFTY